MIIREKDRLRLFDIFNEIDLPFEVWAYGSRVTGRAHEASDLDLVIRMDDLSKMPFQVLGGLKDKIMLSTVPIVVDLHDWARIPESFHQHILESYEVFYKSEAFIAAERPEPYGE